MNENVHWQCLVNLSGHKQLLRVASSSPRCGATQWILT